MDDFQIQNEEIQRIMKETGRAIGRSLPKGWGFALLIFDFKENGAMFYCSNATRESMIEAMKEFIQKNS